MDLDNETGARQDMMKQWRLAVRTARQWKSPGILWDPEAYNDYRTYDVSYLAKLRGESVDQVIEKCEKVGADLRRSSPKNTRRVSYGACSAVWRSRLRCPAAGSRCLPRRLT